MITCNSCNAPATKRFGLMVDAINPVDTLLKLPIRGVEMQLHGVYCDNCFARRMKTYADSLDPFHPPPVRHFRHHGYNPGISLPPSPFNPDPFTGFAEALHRREKEREKEKSDERVNINLDGRSNIADAVAIPDVDIQSYLDPIKEYIAKTIRPAVDAVAKRIDNTRDDYLRDRMVKENKNSVKAERIRDSYDGIDPAGRAERVLDDDSKQWAKEYITTPTDTPMSKAEELQRKYRKEEKPRPAIIEDIVQTALLRLQGKISPGKKSITVTVEELAKETKLTPDLVRRALGWLKYKDLIPKGVKIDEQRQKLEKEKEKKRGRGRPKKN